MYRKYKGKHYKKELCSNIKINIKTPKWVRKFKHMCADVIDYTDNYIEELVKEIKELFLEIKTKIGDWYEECR